MQTNRSSSIIIYIRTSCWKPHGDVPVPIYETWQSSPVKACLMMDQGRRRAARARGKVDYAKLHGAELQPDGMKYRPLVYGLCDWILPSV